MRKRILSIVLILLAGLPALAQKKEISAARDNVKKGTNLESAENSMLKLLADSANRENEKVWDVLFESLKKQYQQGNEKLYLKQKQDTAALFSIASRMFTCMEAYDSIDARPDKKGKIRLQYRKDNSALLNALRPNLYNGGLYYLTKQKWGDAYQMFDQYIDAASQPLFAHYRYAERDTLMAEVAYWAAFAAYKQGDMAALRKHAPLALTRPLRQELTMQYLAESCQLQGDTASYHRHLREGFQRYPRSDFFYPRLIDYYTQQHRWTEALSLTDQALAADSTRQVYHLTRASVLLNLGRYEESFAISDSLLQRNDSLVEAQLYAGLAKYNIGVSLDKKARTTRDKKAVNAIYRDALPYLEAYRKARPERKDAWALPLYTIYLNLNMGDKFDEIDALLK